MKISTLLFALFTCTISFAQKIDYTYDATGNRTMRKMHVEPCNNCPNTNNHRTAAPAPTDSVQTIALQHGVNVFPNPTQDKVVLSISNLQDGETPEVIVTDETGKTLYTAKNLQAQNEINMATYNTGTYFVRLIMGKDVMVYKVMKIQ